ncbi:MAG TPA: hypothetical protein VG742_14400 [Dongiaceae bacterium]|nr:hypothetical protein [Dongiaceae bacterium]
MKHASSWMVAGLGGVAFAIGFTAPALAYVGPGAGLTLLGALWGLIAAVVMSVGFIVLWPFRRFLWGRRHKREATPADRGIDELDDSSMLANRTDRNEP